MDGDKSAYLVSDHDTAFGDGVVYIRLHGCGTAKKIDESASCCWCGDLYTHLVAIHRRLVGSQEREAEEVTLSDHHGCGE